VTLARPVAGEAAARGEGCSRAGCPTFPHPKLPHPGPGRCQYCSMMAAVGLVKPSLNPREILCHHRWLKFLHWPMSVWPAPSGLHPAPGRRIHTGVTRFRETSCSVFTGRSYANRPAFASVLVGDARICLCYGSSAEINVRQDLMTDPNAEGFSCQELPRSLG